MDDLPSQLAMVPAIVVDLDAGIGTSGTADKVASGMVNEGSVEEDWIDDDDISLSQSVDA